MQGGCHCKAICYQTCGEPISHALCHCSDCRQSSGAPFVAWAMFKEDQVIITKGAVKVYNSSPHVSREFCEACGTGLFYKNSVNLPNIIDVQSATFDEPEKLAPQCHIQTAERISWVKNCEALPEFERFPPHE